MTVITHWLEADELPKCQHCPNHADERSFMCEDHAYEADTEVETLTEQLKGAVEALTRIEGVYTRTMPGPRDALRDQVLEIIAAYRSATGGR